MKEAIAVYGNSHLQAKNPWQLSYGLLSATKVVRLPAILTFSTAVENSDITEPVQGFWCYSKHSQAM